MAFSILFVLALCGTAEVLTKEIPSYIQICKRDQNTIDDCVRHSIEALRPRLAQGLPELGVPGIDPFYIPELSATNVGSPIRAVGKDVKVTGAGNFTIKALSVDLDTFTIKARVRFPKLHLDGKYKVDTTILGIPLNGQGTMKTDAVKCDAELVIYAQTFEQNGQEFIKFSKMDTNLNIKDYRIRLEGLFNGDKVLGDATNEALNQNRGEFLRAAKPILEKTVTKLLLDIANKVVKDIALDDVLPRP
ncbi:putative beta-carotene-binding protein [Amyelois transitella]|uniref:putative beta-carotene-binding protein n=1 Tax=Amyelois transitella TaxID=680683 RepID=UPI00298F90EC|nr:putative beta-carotene-binding protein [Amyelois transitella]